jgi:single-strand DNA-binding protein
MAEITIVGNVGQEPVRKTTAKGDPMLTLSVAENTRRRDANGTWGDGPTSWYDIVVFGTIADHAGRSLHSGDRVIVKGTQEVQTYVTKAGGTGKRIQVKAASIGHDLLFVTTLATRTTAPKAAPASATPADEWANPMADVVPETGEVVGEYLPDEEPDWMHAA